jgi:putative ABC transport system permease protein
MARFLAMLRLALRALTRNGLRSSLTMLGIVIGVAAITAMVGVGTGAKAQMEDQVAGLGQNVIMVLAGSLSRGGVFTGMGGVASLTVEDAAAIRREVEGVLLLSPEVRGAVQLAAGEANWNTALVGEGEDYPALRIWPLAAGDFFSGNDVQAAARVVVLGRTAATKLFGNEDPVGRLIRIRDIPFTVIGVLAAKGTNMMGHDQDDTAIVPYTTAMRRLFGVTSLRVVNVSAVSPEAVSPVAAEIGNLLRQRHRIAVDHDEDFMIRTQEEINAFATSTANIMTALLGAIAGVSLIVGGIGIMNIMLVSVTERTREIGLRLAVGARKRDILLQFLAEALLLSVAGGVAGIGAGVLASDLLAREFQWPTLTPVNAMVGAFLFSAAVGVFFGFYPARKAAGLDPIVALRHE